MNAISKIKANATRANKGAAKSNASWLGTPVLIPGEDAAAFDEFAERIRSALKPANAIEEIYVDDAIFHGCEVRRWRRANLVPLLGMLFDFLENAAAALVMARYPQPTPVVDMLAGVLTALKWLFVYASFALLLVTLLAAAWRRLKSGRS